MAYLGWGGLLLLATACHGDCYTLRSVQTSGVFGDTLVAASGSGSDPGTVRFEISEREYADVNYRSASFVMNATGVVDSVTLYRLALVSDASRVPVFSATRNYTNMDTIAFNKLWVHLATEDVLFEVVGKNGGVGKALLNLENRAGPKEACDPWT